MTARGLTRRASLLLPFILAACGGERQDFPTLRYTYLPPFRLNVATIQIDQRFVPSGIPPDVSQIDPDPPVDALRQMGQDRLVAVGTVDTAVFSITNASLTKQDDVITGQMTVDLSIIGPDGERLGFAEAQVSRQHTGHIDDLRATLYDMTKAMMDAMNVEFQFQLQRNLPQWLVTTSAVPPPVQAQPLPMAPAAPPPPPSDVPAAPPPPPSYTPGAPPPPTPMPLNRG
ncbi:MAG TPA: hypothetical protein VGG99_25420 [Acetobacteraceae bacterium]|jgi:hypothetical protein